MIKDITAFDLNLLSVFARDYAAAFTIREITRLLGINYSHAFGRIKTLVETGILREEKKGYANEITLNIQNLDTIAAMALVERRKAPALDQVIEEIVALDPSACVGIFGSRADGTAKADSDWDIFIISEEKGMRTVGAKFPHRNDLHIEAFTPDEFKENLSGQEETVVWHIVRNKLIIHNPYPFYIIMRGTHAGRPTRIRTSA